jgi:hypothetical protein
VSVHGFSPRGQRFLRPGGIHALCIAAPRFFRSNPHIHRLSTETARKTLVFGGFLGIPVDYS